MMTLRRDALFSRLLEAAAFAGPIGTTLLCDSVTHA